MTLKIATNKISVNERTGIKISVIAGDPNLLDEKTALFKRLCTFVKFLAGKKTFWQQENWNDAIYPSGPIVRSAQTGYLISMKPQNITGELSSFDQQLEIILSELEKASNEKRIFRPYYDLLKESK